VAQGDELLLAHACAITHGDAGLDALAIVLAGAGKGGSFDDVFMGIEGFVYFARGDVLAAFDDQLLEAAGDEHVAVFVHAAQVAGA
jgi:hypothetical protein